MDNLSSTVNNILDILGQMELSQDAVIVSEFPNRIKENPISKPIVSYGIKKMDASYDSEISSGPVLYVTVDFTVHVPITSSAKDCRDIFIDVIEYLYSKVATLIAFGCGEVEFNRNTSTIELEGYGEIRLLI